MRRIDIFLLICSILWTAAAIYFVYSIGLSILTLDIRPFITGLILIVIACIVEIVMAILAD